MLPSDEPPFPAVSRIPAIIAADDGEEEAER